MGDNYFHGERMSNGFPWVGAMKKSLNNFKMHFSQSASNSWNKAIERFEADTNIFFLIKLVNEIRSY